MALVEMHRAVDDGKDQSYVLGVLDQEQLRHSLFPLGGSTKPAVREEAAARGLRVADKPDSHDICFVANGDNAGWLREKLGDRAPNHGGAIRDESGAELGATTAPTRSRSASARGCASGRRPPTASRGSSSTSSRCPGPSRSVRASGWPCTGSPASGRAGAAPRRPGSRAPVSPCSCGPTAASTARWSSVRDQDVEVELLDPAYGIAPGQAAVVYDGTRVVGSATIASTVRESQPSQESPVNR